MRLARHVELGGVGGAAGDLLAAVDAADPADTDALIEAARLDGANDWQLMTKIVWPLVAPATTVVVILTFIGSFNWFELPYVMTGLDGSPGGATDVLGLYFYRTAFGSATSGLQDFGRASALAVLMFILIAVVSTFWTQALRRREIQE